MPPYRVTANINLKGKILLKKKKKIIMQIQQKEIKIESKKVAVKCKF